MLVVLVVHTKSRRIALERVLRAFKTVSSFDVDGALALVRAHDPALVVADEETNHQRVKRELKNIPLLVVREDTDILRRAYALIRRYKLVAAAVDELEIKDRHVVKPLPRRASIVAPQQTPAATTGLLDNYVEPLIAAPHARRGYALYERGAYEDALKVLDQSKNALGKERVLVLWWRGLAQARLGNFEQAARDFETALGAARDIEARRRRGAARDTQQIAGLRFNLALALASLGDDEAALEQLATGQRDDLLRGLIHRRAGRWREALVEYAKHVPCLQDEEDVDEEVVAAFRRALPTFDHRKLPNLKRKSVSDTFVASTSWLVVTGRLDASLDGVSVGDRQPGDILDPSRLVYEGEAELVALPRDDEALRNARIDARRETCELLTSVFDSWQKKDVARLAHFAVRRVYRKSERLVCQATCPDSLVVIVTGLCRVETYEDRRARSLAQLDKLNAERERISLRYVYHTSLKPADTTPFKHLAEYQGEGLTITERRLSRLDADIVQRLEQSRHPPPQSSSTKTLGILMPPKICGELAVLEPDKRPATHSVFAETRVEALLVHKYCFQAFRHLLTPAVLASLERQARITVPYDTISVERYHPS